MPLNDLVADGKKLAQMGFLFQSGLAIVMIGISWSVFSANSAMSVALGAACSIIPNSIFAFYSFRFSGARQSDAVAKSTGKGMRMKLIFVAIIIAFSFKFFGAQPIFLFSAFAMTTIIYWLTLFWMSRATVAR